MNGVAAVEVADVANARIVVMGTVRIGSAHCSDRNVLEHGESAELCRGGGHTGVTGRAEDSVPVVPEGQRLGNAAAHVHVAVTARAAFAGDRVSEQRVPDR